LTTINRQAGRVAMHAVPEPLLEAQTAALGLPLTKVYIPDPCSNEQYEEAMRVTIDDAKRRGVTAVAFGDLFLEDVRRYREEKLAPTGLRLLFPLWGRPTEALCREMVDAGLRANITCVDPKQLPAAFVGRTYDASFLDDLPNGVDPCGENGEFHSFVYAGPMFPQPLHVQPGAIVERGGFVFVDLHGTEATGSAPRTLPPWIPESLRDRIDLRELIHDAEALREGDCLERELGCHVAAYDRQAKGMSRGLCEVFRSAELPDAAVKRLAEAERRIPGALFVAYAKPLERRQR
jgi:uncharacterized protein (TIGR00290 family)